MHICAPGPGLDYRKCVDSALEAAAWLQSAAWNWDGYESECDTCLCEYQRLMLIFSMC
jgi:hypothetical protein